MKKQHVAIFLFMIMLTGLFWSRAVLSLSQGAWLLYAVWQYKTWWPLVKKDALLIWSCCPLVLCLSGCYQQPLAAANYDYLFTLSVYPVAAMAVRSTDMHVIQRKWMVVLQCAALAGLIYALGWYLLHMQQAATDYGAGRSLPTFMDTDHVRFGIFTCCVLLFTFLYKGLSPRGWIITVLITGILFLAVRTAWIILLMMFLYWAAVSIATRSKNSFRYFIFLVLLLTAIMAAAYYLFPTIQQKVAYTIYDWQQFKPGIYRADFSDGARRAVNHAAWQAIAHNGGNTGWAGIPSELVSFFSTYNPGSVLNYGWPFNQWLFWWMGSGWWGMLLFTAWLCYPLYAGIKTRNNGIICWTIAIALSCLVECTLNYQYGVWLHAWPMAMLWTMDRKDSNAAMTAPFLF